MVVGYPRQVAEAMYSLVPGVAGLVSVTLLVPHHKATALTLRLATQSSP